MLFCRKCSGQSASLAMTYIGICEGVTSSFTHRLAGHIGTATQPCHEDTTTQVGRHFRLPGHDHHRDIVMLPIEIVSPSDTFLLKARETANILKFKTEKRKGVLDIEHGLNLDEGQT